MRIQDLIRRLMDFPMEAQVYFTDGAGGEDVYIISDVTEVELELESGLVKGVVIG